MDKENEILEDGAILVEDQRIKEIGPSEELPESADRTIDAEEKIVLPGIIDSHTHSTQFLARNRAKDIPFPIWDSDYLFKAYVSGRKEYKMAAYMAGIEALKSGVTCILDNVFTTGGEPSHSIPKVFGELGIRSCIALGFMDKSVPSPLKIDREIGLEESEKYFNKWNGSQNERLKVFFGPPGFGMCSQESLEDISSLADKLNTKVQIHTSGTQSSAMDPLWDHKKREIGFLKGINVLKEESIAVHCTYVNDDDIAVLKNLDAKVVHCPVSNSNLAFGIAPVPKMISNGLHVSLGTDGLGSFTIDLFEVMRTTAYLHKVNSLDSTIIDAEEILRMATIGGAETLGLTEDIGSLEVGKKADIITIDTTSPHFLSRADPISEAVYCAKSSDVSDVIIDGNIIMENRNLKDLDWSRLKNEISKTIDGFWDNQ